MGITKQPPHKALAGVWISVINIQARLPVAVLTMNLAHGFVIAENGVCEVSKHLSLG
jgi:hypothetical protein